MPKYFYKYSIFLALLFASVSIVLAQSPSITAIEPPEWWVNMPAPMLLVRGENLAGATFSSSDPKLALHATTISANGHWAIVRLDTAPAKPETIRITTSNAGGKASADYIFSRRRSASEGFAGFSSKDVVYLIMTDRFADGDLTNNGTADVHTAELAKPHGWHGGDLRGIEQHLDYLEALGITTVWMTPVYQNHGDDSYHGYGATNLYAVDEHFGTLSDFQHLVNELHRRGMKLVLDTVPNHIGPNHPWVTDEPEPTWFHGTQAQHHKAVGEFAPLVNPHAPWRDQQDILEGWFADVLPDMNQENPDAAQYLTQNAIWWIEQTGADGLRIDTFPYVARPFWHDFHASIRALYPRITTVGEVFNKDPVITSAFAGGVTRTDMNGSVDTGLSTPFDFPTYFAIRDVFLHGAPMSEFADILRQDSLYPHPERLVPFLGNHDTKRFLGEEGATPDKLKLAFAVLLTMRGMPQIYSGDEIAMTGGDDPDNRRDFPGGFTYQSQSAFNTAQRTPDQADMFSWVQTLLKLRAQYSELNAGDEQVLYADADTLVYVRGSSLGQGCSPAATRVLVAVNISGDSKTIPTATRNTALAGCNNAQVLLGNAMLSQESLALPAGVSILSLK